MAGDNIFFVTTAHLEVMEGALMRLQEVSWQGLNFPVACVTWPQEGTVVTGATVQLRFRLFCCMWPGFADELLERLVVS